MQKHNNKESLSRQNQCVTSFCSSNSDGSSSGASIAERQIGSCISSCAGLEAGDYQSCHGCNVYASCSGGRLIDDLPCPASLVWDDIKKRCNNGIMEAFIKRRIPGKTTCSKAIQYNSNKVVIKLKLY